MTAYAPGPFYVYLWVGHDMGVALGISGEPPQPKVYHHTIIPA